MSLVTSFSVSPARRAAPKIQNQTAGRQEQSLLFMAVMMNINLITSVFFLTGSAVLAYEQFCANIQPSEASGANGFVALQVASGQAMYDFSVDLTNFATTCDLSQGLKYHVHSYWTNATSNSAANGFCGTAGLHYDPNLACSTKSQDLNTLCPAINRTVAHNYVYNCNSTVYNQGHYANCELGDISGKNGVIRANAGTKVFALPSPFTDYQPIYSANYGVQTKNSLQWMSWVFHCAADNNALVCAKFSPTDLSACQTSINSFNVDTSSSGGGDDDGYTHDEYLTGVLVSVLVCLFAGIVIGIIFTRFFCGRPGTPMGARAEEAPHKY